MKLDLTFDVVHELNDEVDLKTERVKLVSKLELCILQLNWFMNHLDIHMYTHTPHTHIHTHTHTHINTHTHI